MAVLRGVARGGVEDGGETEREKKSKEAALRKRRRKMAALHLVVVRWRNQQLMVSARTGKASKCRAPSAKILDSWHLTLLSLKCLSSMAHGD
ncbi:hypothetical protein MRB53_032465 [Persea americana]|uniref:Uncharacterized protein n=1 Tax=Persea americana TaxID=3435 RepID=A0ACC2KSA8_PERAE|nr:hypothetical protein MRB53_032465 [Persea americana]